MRKIIIRDHFTASCGDTLLDHLLQQVKERFGVDWRIAPMDLEALNWWERLVGIEPIPTYRLYTFDEEQSDGTRWFQTVELYACNGGILTTCEYPAHALANYLMGRLAILPSAT